MEQKGIRVKCTNPSCRNKRLFDIETLATGIVKIKCDKCGSVVSINLNNVTEGKRYLYTVG